MISHTEAESKAILAKAGIPFPKQCIVGGKAELSSVLVDFTFPIVMKISSPDIAHKTEAGGVKLGIGSLAEAQAAFDEILASCRSYKPDAHLDGVLVQEMAAAGTEMIVGVSSNRQFGPMLLVGMGGVFVEVFKDMAMAPCPVSSGPYSEPRVSSPLSPAQRQRTLPNKQNIGAAQCRSAPAEIFTSKE